MLKLSITGPPGSAHREIGNIIANRLSLKYVSACKVANTLCTQDGIPYHIFKGHSEKDLDAKVTKYLLEVEKGTDLLLCDSLYAAKMESSISVLVMQDLLADKPRAPGIYDETLREYNLVEDTTIFSPTSYSIAIHQFYLSVADCVKVILDCLTAGLTDITLIHPYQVLLLYPSFVPKKIPDYINQKKVFDVLHYGFAYYLTNPEDYADYITYLRYGKLMSVHVVEERPQQNNLASVSLYSWMRRLVSEQVHENLMFGHMLSRYGAAYEVLDINQVYLDLSKNSNPYKRLREEGFDK